MMLHMCFLRTLRSERPIQNTERDRTYEHPTLSPVVFTQARWSDLSDLSHASEHKPFECRVEVRRVDVCGADTR